jgi:hypothetical protein
MDDSRKSEFKPHFKFKPIAMPKFSQRLLKSQESMSFFWTQQASLLSPQGLWRR